MTPSSMKKKIGRRTGVVIDAALLLLVILWISLTELGAVPHPQVGFYCGDKSISHKYNGDTVTAPLLVVSAVAPLLIIYAVELSRNESESKGCVRVKKSLLRSLLYFKDYAIGILGKLIVVVTLKVVLGELRPHFLDTCIPDKAKNCTEGTYIQDYKCTNQVDKYFFINDSSRSFPSGHSSIAFFEAAFLIWYFQRRFPKNKSFALLPFLQCLFLCWACFCAASRITDHRHHWWDVLGGVILGIVFAILTCTILSRNFKKHGSTMEIINQNGSTERHTSVRRLLSTNSNKGDVTLDVTMNHINPS